MKTFIVEDSRLARQELRTLLALWPQVQVVGEAADVDNAVAAIVQQQPDLLLLDIHLPGGTGFDVLDRLERVPLVIFTTAYHHHAVDAFERNALDYLLKPIESERLGRALQRAGERWAAARPVLTTEIGASPPARDSSSAASAEPAPARKGAEDTLFVRDGERCWFVCLADVSGFEAYGNYARVWFKGERPLLARTLGYLEERLDPMLFFRASRSHLINLRWVSEVTPWVTDGYKVTLRDGREVEVSRRQAKVLRERLEI